MKDNSTILRRYISPYRQGAFIFSLLVVFNLIAYLLRLSGVETGENLVWEISLTLLLFFALANTVFFLNAKEKGKYWSQSITTFIIIGSLTVFIANFLSEVKFYESGSIKWIYFIFSFSYLIFISIIGLMRRIVEIAIKQDKKLRGEQ